MTWHNIVVVSWNSLMFLFFYLKNIYSSSPVFYGSAVKNISWKVISMVNGIFYFSTLNVILFCRILRGIQHQLLNEFANWIFKLLHVWVILFLKRGWNFVKTFLTRLKWLKNCVVDFGRDISFLILILILIYFNRDVINLLKLCWVGFYLWFFSTAPCVTIEIKYRSRILCLSIHAIPFLHPCTKEHFAEKLIIQISPSSSAKYPIEYMKSNKQKTIQPKFLIDTHWFTISLSSIQKM